MITTSSAQTFTKHIVHLLEKKAKLTLLDDERESTENIVMTLLENESLGVACLDLSELNLTPQMVTVLGTAPLHIHTLSESKQQLFTARTFAAITGVRQWFEETIATAASNTTFPAKMLFTPMRLTDGNLELGEDDQIPAILKAAYNPFTVITGGPGTGKTTIISACLAEMFLRDPNLKPEHVILTAPTGKAAQRLSEGINFFNARYLGNQSQSLRDKIKGVPEAITLHRLLRASKNRTLPIEGEVAKLSQRVVVVDECSMVGAELMCTLLISLAAGAKLILVGDADQLPAVDVGSVFQEIVSTLEQKRSPLLQRLIRSRRSVQEIISEARKALEKGIQADFPWQPLRKDENIAQAPVRFIRGVEGQRKDIPYEHLVQDIVHRVFNQFSADPEWAASPDGFTRFKIIAPMREGIAGVKDLNSRMHELARVQWKRRRAGLLVGEPVMITENIHSLGLNNGDVGIVVADPHAHLLRAEESAELRARFFRGSSEATYLLDRLTGRIERAWASTCHKAQGSEYENVIIFLPEGDCKLLTPQWLYTAMTRAKKTVTVVWGGKKEHK